MVLHVHHEDGADLEVRVRFAGCAERWVASPHGVSHVTQAQLTALLGQLRYGYSWTDIPAH